MSDTVGIIGLGLIGGSIARDLSAAGLRVLGHDANPSTIAAAAGDGVLDGVLGDDFGRAADCQILIIATPVDQTSGQLEQLAKHASAARLITDVGSTKRVAVAAAEKLGLANFVGSHPLAGDHLGGWSASRRGLFDDARVFLCASEVTTAEALTEAEALWSMLGAKTEHVDAARHDALLAFTSHLSQALATALGVTLASRGVHRSDLGAGGRDATRLAESSAAVWAPILMENATFVLEGLDAFDAEVRALRQAIANRDREAISRIFRAAAEWTQS